MHIADSALLTLAGLIFAELSCKRSCSHLIIHRPLPQKLLLYVGDSHMLSESLCVGNVFFASVVSDKISVNETELMNEQESDMKGKRCEKDRGKK